MKSIVLLFSLVFFPYFIFSQVQEEWSVRYNGPGDDYDQATSVAVDNSGNIYVTGASTGTGSDIDFYTVKYSPAGTPLWSARYNGPANDADDAYGIKLDNSGNVYVYGSSTGTSGGYDFCIIKYNSSGVQQWVFRYNGTGNSTDEVYGIVIDNTGNVYATGYSRGSTSSDDILTVKLNSNGDTLWTRRYNGSLNDDDYGNSIVLDNQANIIVTGAVTTNTDLDYITIKYSPSGNLIWTAIYNGPGNEIDFPSSNAVDSQGNIYVTGFSMGSGSNYDYYTIKYNSLGVQQWSARYNGTANSVDEAYSVVLDNNANVYVTGNSRGSTSLDDYLTIKYNSNGTQLWVARYDGTGNADDYANSIQVDAQGNCYVTGQSWGVNSMFDYLTIKFKTSDGTPEWSVRYNGPVSKDDESIFVQVDANNNVYITGGSTGTGDEYDYFTVKYSQTIGIKPLGNQIPSDFALYQNYPNPFNPSTKIRFSIPINPPFVKGGTLPSTGGFITLKIFDVLGREVSTLVNEQLKPGTYEIEWDGANFPSGVYYYSFLSDEFKETRRMILLK